eukprot:4715581-Pyramimonas_sp.AAC.1
MKQGCPLSGVLVAIILNPIHKYILRRHMAIPMCMPGFADDLALVTVDIFGSCQLCAPSCWRQVAIRASCLTLRSATSSPFVNTTGKL